MTVASRFGLLLAVVTVGGGVLGCPKPPLPGGPPPEYEAPRPFPGGAGADERTEGGGAFDDLPAAPTPTAPAPTAPTPASSTSEEPPTEVPPAPGDAVPPPKSPPASSAPTPDAKEAAPSP